MPIAPEPDNPTPATDTLGVSESGRPLLEPFGDAGNIAIGLENISVRYRVPRERYSGIKEYAIRAVRGMVIPNRRLKFEDFWALNDVSASIYKGEIFGVIGRNGSGKSTLLKVIARVLTPTRGRIITRGKLAPLLELGAGFQPELTGRENIYLNSALLGRSRSLTRSLLSEILDFAEISEFIDAPLRTYSTGMVARLGFAVATSIRPNILLVDEVLSVGDSQFQQKCLDRMYAFQDQGTTIIIVSHGMGAIETFCQRGLWLDKGHVKAIGDVDEVIKQYVYMNRPPKTLLTAKASEEVEITPKLAPPPPLTEGYYRLAEIGSIYPAQAILEPDQGSVSVWIKFEKQAAAQPSVIFHTDDSRYVIYVNAEETSPEHADTWKLIARAGGNRRTLDTYFGTSSFPEVSALIGQASPRKISGKGHMATLTWQGYPEGALRLFIDGMLVGEKNYTRLNDRGDPLPTQIAIGMRPSNWTGELVQDTEGNIVDSRPHSTMTIEGGGVEIRELRLYQRALTQEEILLLSQEPGMNPPGGITIPR